MLMHGGKMVRLTWPPFLRIFLLEKQGFPTEVGNLGTSFCIKMHS